jgi:predicted esterase
MNSSEKEISYQITNTYSTLNVLTTNTKNIWFVCHGMGYLSRYFLKYFKDLNSQENYIIAPQAPSKYYISPGFKHVGASWLTKEQTLKEAENIMQYFDVIFESEHITQNKNLVVLGYSQGVSVALRYIVKKQLQCSHIAILSGGIPKELVPSDFSFLNNNTKVFLIYGNNDEYLNEERILFEKNRAIELFGNAVTIIPFDGKHEIKKEMINQILLK